MEIRTNFEGSNAIDNVTPISQPSTPRPSSSPSPSAQPSTSLAADQATVSNVASGVAQLASSDDVRMEKVASIQAALANGTYNVSASAVASKLVDSMLAGK